MTKSESDKKPPMQLRYNLFQSSNLYSTFNIPEQLCQVSPKSYYTTTGCPKKTHFQTCHQSARIVNSWPPDQSDGQVLTPANWRQFWKCFFWDTLYVSLALHSDTRPYNKLRQKDGDAHSILSTHTNLWLQRIKHGNKQHCLILTWRALGSPVKSPSLQTKHH